MNGGVRGNYFHETTLVVLFTTHINLLTMEFPLIFSEPNFVKVQKIRKSTKFTALKKEHPTVFSQKFIQVYS